MAKRNEQAPLRIALAGNPNSGKSSLFNALTGANQHVGNYPGITVERRNGRYSDQGRRVEVVDLPGTYSLSAHSPEEQVAEQALLRDDLDVVVVVVDSTSLQRSLMLLAQLMLLTQGQRTRLVLCLNMADEAEKHGQQLDLGLMQQLLGVPVVETVGHKRRGIDPLKQAIVGAAAAEPSPSRLVLGPGLEQALAAIEGELVATDRSGHWRWLAMRALLDLPTAADELHALGEGGKRAFERARQERRTLETRHEQDVALYVIERYQAFISGLLRETLICNIAADRRRNSEALDALLAHRLLGLPLFLLAMYGVFWLTFTIGETPMGWIERGFELLGAKVAAVWPAASAPQLRSLVLDGVLAGVGGVVVFLPNIILLFLCLCLLEDTGYMARAAFLVDRLMHRFGLHGKSFVPMMTGFGCSIPGIMATRTLDNERDRLTTMLVLPLMSCGARLPIWMLLIPAFFPATWRAPALFSIYLVGILLALVLALLLRRTLLRGDEAPFVMELPPYRLPTARAVASRVGERSWLYLRKAGTVILALSVVMWFLTHYPRPDEPPARAAGKPLAMATTEGVKAAAAAVIGDAVPEEQRAAKALQRSYAGQLGKAMEPALAPIGFDWKIGVALIGAFAAKEVFVAQMGIVYAMGETDEESQPLRAQMAADYPPLVGISLILFLLISAPCMATVAVTRRESGSWKWALLQVGGLTAVAYVLCLIVYQVGRLFG